MEEAESSGAAPLTRRAHPESPGWCPASPRAQQIEHMAGPSSTFPAWTQRPRPWRAHHEGHKDPPNDLLAWEPRSPLLMWPGP